MSATFTDLGVACLLCATFAICSTAAGVTFLAAYHNGASSIFLAMLAGFTASSLFFTVALPVVYLAEKHD